MQLSVSTDIAAPAEQAWAVVADYARDPEWRVEVVSMVPEPAGPVRVGTSTSEVARLFGSSFTTPGAVVAVDEGRSFAWRAASSTVDVHGTRVVEPTGPGSSRVTLTYDLRVKGAARAAGPLLRWGFARSVRSNLPRLARLVETEVGSVRN